MSVFVTSPTCTGRVTARPLTTTCTVGLVVVTVVVAFVVILGVQLAAGAPESPSLGLRLAGALLPSFGIMAAALVVLLAVRMARAAHYGVAPMLAGSVTSFVGQKL